MQEQDTGGFLARTREEREARKLLDEVDERSWEPALAQISSLITALCSHQRRRGFDQRQITSNGERRFH